MPGLTNVGGTVPTLGGPFVVEVSDVPHGLAFGIMTFRSGDRVDLTSIGMPGCFGYADVLGPAPVILAGIGDPAPFHLLFPPNPALAGLSFYIQAAVPDSNLAAPLPFSASDGGHAILN